MPQERVVMGLELEAYTIDTPAFEIGRRLAFPRRGVGEQGEGFKRDASIGTEYNSRPFSTIREGFFLLKAGLRKYNQKLYRTRSRSRKSRRLLLVGGWRDRFAGLHLHVSIHGERLSRDRARHLAGHLHDHLPLLIAMTANSPVWADELTDVASNRIARASKIYFRPIRRGELTSRTMDEITFNRARALKPATLEIRVADSNLPEFALAAACVVKAATLAWLARRGASNRLTHFQYLRGRIDAARRGMKARLCWNGRWMTASALLDRFVWTHRGQLALMDIPQDVLTAMKLLKRGINGGAIVAAAARAAYEEHPQTWQRRFAKRYVRGIDHLLNGNCILGFMERLGVPAPDLSHTRLGRRKLALA